MTNYRKLLCLILVMSNINVCSAATSRMIDSYPKEQQIAMIKDNPFTIEFNKNKDKDLQILAVTTLPFVIRVIKNPDEDVQLIAMEKTVDLIRHIDNPTEKVQLIAVQANPRLISEIKNPSEKVQLAVVQANAGLIAEIKNPSEKVQLAVVQANPRLISEIKNPTEEVQLIAFQADPAVISMIKYPSGLVSILGFGIHMRPNNHLTSDKRITLAVENGNELKITNLTNDFITVASLAEYYGDKIYSLDSFTVPPQGITTKYLRTPDNAKIKSLDDMLLYGFAVQYSLPNNSKQFSLFKTNKYKVSDLIKQ